MKWFPGVAILLVLCACGHKAPRGQAEQPSLDPLYQSEGITRTLKMIRADNLQYHREFFTTDGARSGWSAFVDKVRVE